MVTKSQRNRTEIDGSLTEDDPEYRKGRFSSQNDEDEIRRYGRDPEADIPATVWSPRKVENRMRAAAQMIQATVSRVGPGRVRGFWPEYFVAFSDEVGQVDNETHLIEKQTIKTRFSSYEIELGDEALEWPKRYVTDQRILLVFNAWVASQGYRVPRWRKWVKRWGWSLATADRCRDRAKREIVEGLIKDGVKVR